MVKAWNACLRAASRDWICIIHNDDRIAPGALAAIRHAARLAPGAGLIAHQHMAEGMGGARRSVDGGDRRGSEFDGHPVRRLHQPLRRWLLSASSTRRTRIRPTSSASRASSRASTWSLSARRRSSSTAWSSCPIFMAPGARPTSSSSSKRSKMLDDAQVGLGRFQPAGIQLLRVFVGDRAGDDHVVALLPVHRRRDLVLGGELHRVEHAQDLVEVAARGHRVGQHQLDLLVGADDEDRAHGRVVRGGAAVGLPASSAGSMS